MELVFVVLDGTKERQITYDEMRLLLTEGYIAPMWDEFYSAATTISEINERLAKAVRGVDGN